MKEIWINLEFYFESYDFYKFEGFFPDFSDFIFDLKEFKTIKKGQKGIVFRTGPTWVRRGRQGHVAEPRGPMRRDIRLFIFI